MKKWIGLISALLVLVLVVSACGSGNSANNGGNGGTESTESNAGTENASNDTADNSGSGSEEQVTLKFMGWEASPLETESVKNGLDIFMKQNPNIKVEYTTLPGGTNYVSKMQAMLLGNEAPDVFFMASDFYRDFIKRGYLLDISTYIGTDFSTEDLIPSAIEISEVDGKFYGIESCTVSPVMYYNKDIFDKAGLSYPPSDPNKAWTWQEFIDTAKQLTVKKGDKVDQYGVYGYENYYMTLAGIMSNGGDWFNDEGTASIANTAEVKGALEAIRDLRTKEGVSPEAKLLQNAGMSPAQMLQTGKIAMLIDGSWALQELATMKFPVGVAALPKLKDAVTHGQAHLHVGWANTKHPEETWKLIKFLSSEDYQLQNVRSGLWMPNRQSFYTEEGIGKWLTEGVHPEGFKELIPFFINANVYSYATLGVGAQKISENTGAELDKFFLVGQDVDTTVQNIEKMANEILSKKE